LASKQTYLERLIGETIRPILGALELLKQEMTETLQTPDAPSKILHKPYAQLTEQEVLALFDISHTEGETEPCPMCSWVAREELMRARKDKEELGG